MKYWHVCNFVQSLADIVFIREQFPYLVPFLFLFPVFLPGFVGFQGFQGNS